jgi:uncharacterized protein
MNRNPVLPNLALPSEPKGLQSINLLVPQTYSGHGFLTVDQLPRVAVEVADVNPGDGFEWAVNTFFDGVAGGEPRLMMDLRLAGQAQLVCQRCMRPCPIQINELRRFIFFADEAMADAYPIEDDALEPLVMSSHFDLLATIEDEILLSIPLIPMHPEGVCAAASVSSDGTQGSTPDSATEKPENPFNILKNMKKKD